MGYTITFFDRAERKYQLLIDGGGTALDGGAVTFETQEDANADMFTPVRCQTGTFRYIGTNDHSNWLAIIPADALSKVVKLQRRENSSWVTYWQGYIQPQVFENEYPGLGTVEHEFAVQCPLSVLDTIDIDPTPTTTINNTPTITFGALLQTYVFSRLTGITISGYIMQGSKAVTEARLGVKVMWANFLDTDSNNNVVCKYTCKQILEEFCKFYGYTCRMNGTKVYFTQPTQDTADFSSYSSLAGTATQVSRGTFSITDAMFADNENHEEVHLGIGKATVRSDINALENLIEIPYDELFDKYNTGMPSNLIIARSVDWYERGVYNLIRVPDENSGNMTYENDNVSLTCYMALKPGTGNGGGNGKKYCRFFVYDDSDVGNDLTSQAIPQSKESFGWRKCIELFRSYNYSGSTTDEMFKITSKQVFVISDGYLYINFKCDEVSAWLGQGMEATPIPPYAFAKLKVGDQYWKGTWDITNRTWTNSGWSNDPSNTFTLQFNSNGARTTRGSVYDPQFSGCGIPVTNTMRGALEFSIIHVPSWSRRDPDDPTETIYINGFLPLLDFEIGFVRGVIEDTQHRGNEYSVKGGAFRDEVNVDLIWASDVTYGTGNYIRHMPAGVGYILDNSDKPKQTVSSMLGTQVIAEQDLANVIANYGLTTHRVVKVNLRDSLVGSVTPQMLSSGLETGLFPLAVSHNWRDDVTTITMIEV